MTTTGDSDDEDEKIESIFSSLCSAVIGSPWVILMIVANIPYDLP